ncbi:vWA domain-containing protein [Allofrancisella frigidaquae]|uniref:VWA domain-containing protein n=1 Tax=Allofrancisella frigidaquae TaxID=1085644 RepID=A0A6M3HVP6_9GAMM|nr:VWA domain-containing protein [Allofrancisella frigidaquae]KEI35163.1 TPR domain protein in aerotolerance operon [Francisella sp. W12-1067]QIV95245.1 VWA domain-containing protein [Allofrancisella frigidaquae]
MMLHFLRPWWLLALIPALFTVVFLFRNSAKINSWAKYCDKHLLDHLLVGQESRIKKSLLPLGFLLLWGLAIVALAGPTWKFKETSVYQKSVSRVLTLDVSQSMDTTDVSPSRLERAKYKIFDILKRITEGQVGMVVFSSEAFVVSPLTSDAKTVENLVSVLNTGIVPVQGNDIAKALQKSAELISQAGATEGQIILITDSTPNEKAIEEAQTLSNNGITVDVYAIGTPKGGIAKDKNGNYLKDEQGNIGYFGVNLPQLQSLAKAGGGKLITLTANNDDVKALLTSIKNNTDAKKSELSSVNIFWQDEGVYIIWILTILSALLFRRGFLERICR